MFSLFSLNKTLGGKFQLHDKKIVIINVITTLVIALLAYDCIEGSQIFLSPSSLAGGLMCGSLPLFVFDAIRYLLMAMRSRGALQKKDMLSDSSPKFTSSLSTRPTVSTSSSSTSSPISTSSSSTSNPTVSTSSSTSSTSLSGFSPPTFPSTSVLTSPALTSSRVSTACASYVSASAMSCDGTASFHSPKFPSLEVLRRQCLERSCRVSHPRDIAAAMAPIISISQQIKRINMTLHVFNCDLRFCFSFVYGEILGQDTLIPISGAEFILLIQGSECYWPLRNPQDDSYFVPKYSTQFLEPPYREITAEQYFQHLMSQAESPASLGYRILAALGPYAGKIKEQCSSKLYAQIHRLMPTVYPLPT